MTKRSRITRLCAAIAGVTVLVLLALSFHRANYRLLGRGHASQLSEVPYLQARLGHMPVTDLEYRIVGRYRYDEALGIGSITKQEMEEWLLAHPEGFVSRGSHPEPSYYVAIVQDELGKARGSWSSDCWTGYSVVDPKTTLEFGYDPISETLWMYVRLDR